MKMTMIEAMMAIGTMSIIGYCCMNKSPKKKKKARNMLKETAKTIYNNLDKIDCQD